MTRTLVGNEPMQSSNVSIRLSSSTTGVEIDPNNNDLMGGPVMIRYTAIADLDITIL